MDKSGQLPTLQSVRARLCRRIHAARTTLNSPKLISDHDFHAVRKHLKGARAGLRLIRGVIGESRYSIENARLRDAARPLSEVRDSTVLLQTAAELLKTVKKCPGREILLNLTRLLRRERRKVLANMLPDSQTLRSGCLILAESQRTISRWNLDGQSRELTYDVERIYRKSRKVMSKVRDELTDDTLHEARKQVKYLAHALEMLSVKATRHSSKLLKLAKDISELLGADRDLALIQSKLLMIPKAKLRHGEALCAHIQERRQKLQRDALRNGKRLHLGKARAFIKRLSLI